jgi:ubiquinone/menaquinone biosynthesis C-methylase UbiE
MAVVESRQFATGARMSFDLLAPHYRWMEAVLAGNKLQRCRTHWLHSVGNCQKGLLIGEGNGRFLAECAKQFPTAQFTVVDASGEMLRQAQARWRKSTRDVARAEFVHATLPGLKLPKHNFDLIATHCFLDCFDPVTLPTIIAEIASFASPSATWLITDFAVPQRGWPRWRAKAILCLAYSFFRITTKIRARELCPPDPMLERAGFKLRGRIEADSGLIYSAMWERGL